MMSSAGEFFPYDAGSLAPLCASFDAARERTSALPLGPAAWHAWAERDVSLASHLIDPREGGFERWKRALERYHKALDLVLDRAAAGELARDRHLVAELADRLAVRPRRGDARLRWTTDDTAAYRAPVAPLVPGLLDRAFEHAAASPDHPAARAAWLHIVVSLIHPLEDGNGRVSRLLAALVLLRAGYRQPELVLLQGWRDRYPDEYRAIFGSLGPRFDPRADITECVRAAIAAHLDRVLEPTPARRTLRPLDIALGHLTDAERADVHAVAAKEEAGDGRRTARERAAMNRFRWLERMAEWKLEEAGTA